MYIKINSNLLVIFYLFKERLSGHGYGFDVNKRTCFVFQHFHLEDRFMLVYVLGRSTREGSCCRWYYQIVWVKTQLLAIKYLEFHTYFPFVFLGFYLISFESIKYCYCNTLQFYSTHITVPCFCVSINWNVTSTLSVGHICMEAEHCFFANSTPPYYWLHLQLL